MSLLRKEYNTKREQDKLAITEAAEGWVAQNIILITERIDSKSVSRLVNSIQKFEDTFGPYKDRLPAIDGILNSAENALQMVVTGRVNDKKTGNLLMQFTYLYATLSDFFSRDLPVLLTTKMFTVAKENPETTMDTLRKLSATKGPTHDVRLIHDTFAHALMPTKDEKRLLNKIYKGITLPRLDAQKIADELVRLSYNDLEELTKVGQIPMVVAPEKGTEVEPGATPETKGGEAAPNAAAVPEGVENKTTNFLEVAGNSNGETITEELSAQEVLSLMESKMLLTEATVDELTKSLAALKRIVDSTPAFIELKPAVSALYSKSLASLSDDKIVNFLKQKLTPSALQSFYASSTKGQIVAQANLAVETFQSLADAYKTIAPILEDENVTKEDLVNITKILSKAANGSIIKRIATFFKVRPFKGLSPDEIVAAITKPLNDAINQYEQEQTASQAAEEEVDQAVARGEETTQ